MIDPIILFVTFIVIIVIILIALIANRKSTPQNQNLIKDETSDIINKQIAEPHEFPYQAYLKIDKNGVCGGSLIKENLVLTAAHCVDGVEQVEVVLGAQKPSLMEPSQVVMRSNKIIVHEDYNRSTKLNDIALIKLPKPVPLNKNIQTVKLATDNSQTFAGKIGKASGWGRTKCHVKSSSEELRYSVNKILSNTECSEKLLHFIPSSQVCLSGDGGHPVCRGDSGGPLTVDGIQGGIVSGGKCQNGCPAIFTRVSTYTKWIAKNAM